MTAEQERKGLPETIAKIITALRIGDFMDVLPLGNEGFYLYSTRGAEGKIQTVTRTHVRLPKLSHLITAAVVYADTEAHAGISGSGLFELRSFS